VSLLRHHRAVDLAQELLGATDRALHALRARRQLELRAEEGEHLAPLHRHRLRHDQDQAVAAGGGDEGQRDAGIARGRLDQRAAGLESAGGFQRVDHVDADTVLHARDRVEEFELEQDFGIDAPLLGEPVEAHERRVADGLGDRAVDAAVSGLAHGVRGRGVCHRLSAP
jgi:hypothetical protein